MARTTSALLCAFLAAASVAECSGVVKMGVNHKHIHPNSVPKVHHKRSLRKRQTDVSESLNLNDQWIPRGGYFLDIDIGSNQQTISVLLDTGSSNLFVPSSSAAECGNDNCVGGAFDSSSSTSFSTVPQPAPFKIAYVDGSTVNGSYSKDTVVVGDASLKNYIFALAMGIQVSPGLNPGPQYGIMGVSFDAGEASVCATAAETGRCNVNFTTPTIPDALYSQGFIKSRSYSLYLDDVASGNGSILFGGVDTAKFVGSLTTLAVQPFSTPNTVLSGAYVYQDLLMTGVSVRSGSQSSPVTPSNYSSTVTLDSGAAGLSLPPPIYSGVVSALPAVFNYQGVDAVLCKDAGSDASVTISLSGVDGTSTDVEIPFANLVIPIYSGDYNSTNIVQNSNGDDVCIFGASPGERTGNLMGDPMIRSMYVYYNLDQKTISIGKPSYDSTGTSITAVGSGPVPTFSGSAAPSSTNPSSDVTASSGDSGSGGSGHSAGNSISPARSLGFAAVAGVLLVVGYLI